MTPVRLLLLSGTCRCDFHVSHSFSSYLLSCAERLMLAFSCQISTFRAFFLLMWRYLESWRLTGIIFFKPGGIFLCSFTQFSLVFLLAKVNFMPPPPLLFLNEKLQLTTHWNGATCQRGCTSTLCSIFFFLPTQRNIMCFCVVSFSERPFSDFIPKFSSNCCGNIQCCFFFFFCIVEVLFFNCIFETLFACTFCKACLKSLFCYVAITQTLNMNSDNCVWIISVYLNTSIRE